MFLPAVCHAALLRSTRRLLLRLLSAAQHSAPCFHNSSGTDGWHSCSERNKKLHAQSAGASSNNYILHVVSLSHTLQRGFASGCRHYGPWPTSSSEAPHPPPPRMMLRGDVVLQENPAARAPVRLLFFRQKATKT
ncbi:hypothetical protein F7725_022878 [Dissostichus mawsoni]|uniref:Secreted protein n=1 Tax=Dissostichus mawsoni TaxID=36200 RepID=A0A7J5Z018_DISMA|nr:hypothetical protein F7725_022878 [Dissostichus mawsoni]